MTKDEFLKNLLSEGFICEKSGQYPTVVCEADEVKKVAGKVKSIAKDKGYTSSFAIKSIREGMELISKDGEISRIVAVEDDEPETKEQPIAIAEPIPMTAMTEDATA
ncbi:hypothetical protein [Butyrivibrio sp. AE3004]|uniref:hypothetical protein n=1 Tax=Butyrivibrio sp. AE3004 TaxID=1506994 RepID=UPI0004947FA7|nr:hypothetical protein [Butyrivibrio sp. AE3004]